MDYILNRSTKVLLARKMSDTDFQKAINASLALKAKEDEAKNSMINFMQSLGIILAIVLGDGNCLYASLAYGLAYYNEKSFPFSMVYVKSIILGWLADQKNTEWLSHSYGAENVALLAEQNAWGNFSCVVAASRIWDDYNFVVMPLGVGDIIVIKNGDLIRYAAQPDLCDLVIDKVVILFYGKNHYDCGVCDPISGRMTLGRLLDIHKKVLDKLGHAQPSRIPRIVLDEARPDTSNDAAIAALLSADMDRTPSKPGSYAAVAVPDDLLYTSENILPGMMERFLCLRKKRRTRAEDAEMKDLDRQIRSFRAPIVPC